VYLYKRFFNTSFDLKLIFMNKKLLFIAALLSSFMGSLQAQLPGLLQRFTFDNTLSNTTNTINFLAGSGTSFVADRNGNANSALNFNNAGAIATITNLPDGNSARSISFWVRFSNLLSSETALLNYGSSTTAYGARVAIASNNQTFQHFTGSNFHNASTVALNVWYHYVITYNGTSARTYRQGVLIENSAMSVSTVSDNTLRLGLKPDGSQGNLTGSIDDLQIYDRALSADDVFAVSGNIVFPPILAWNFTGNTTTTGNQYGFSTPANTALSTDRFGVAQRALSINNSGSSANLLNGPLPSGNAVRTVSFWFKRAQSIFQELLYYGNNSSRGIYGVTVAADGSFVNYCTSNSGNYDTLVHTPAQPLTNNTWYHITLVYTKDSAKIYRDGILIGQNSVSVAINTGSFPTSYDFGLGRRVSPVTNIFNGAIDDIKVFNVVLSPAAILQNYNNETYISPGATPNGLVAYYSFNTDFTSHNGLHNMTAVTGTGFGTPTLTTGRFGQGLSLQSGNATLRNNTIVSNLTSSFTVAFWVNRGSINLNFSSAFEVGESAFYRYSFAVPGYEYGAAGVNQISPTPGFSTQTTSAPALNSWTHIAYVYEFLPQSAGAPSRVILYENGEQKATLNLGAIAGSSLHLFNNNFGIGGGSNNGNFNTAKCYVGIIDEFYVYNRALSLAEIRNLMNNSSNTVLPSHLTNFTAQLKNDNAQLFWNTQTETNTSHFNIEYSNNARDYTTVGEVQAAGNSSINKQYSFSHAINKQTTHYYRLKMIDKDGSFNYSNVVKLQNKGVVGIELYPNPVKNQLNISYQFSGREEAVIRISTIEGKVVQTQKMVLDQQGNVGVDVSRLTPGVYVVEVITANNRTVKQVMKE
jgi:hypothetical protein